MKGMIWDEGLQLLYGVVPHPLHRHNSTYVTLHTQTQSRSTTLQLARGGCSDWGVPSVEGMQSRDLTSTAALPFVAKWCSKSTGCSLLTMGLALQGNRMGLGGPGSSSSLREMHVQGGTMGDVLWGCKVLHWQRGGLGASVRI